MKPLPFETLKGKTFTKVEKLNSSSSERDGDQLIFHSLSGEKYKLFHSQECCERVYIEDICGDLDDLVGDPILGAEEVSNSEDFEEGTKPYPQEVSFTWTFYKLHTKKGFVTIRWYGASNGWYAEKAILSLI